MGTKKKKRETLVQLIGGMKAVIGKYWTPKGAFVVPKGGWDPYGGGKRRNPLIALVQRAVRAIKALSPEERDAATKELFGFLYGHDRKKNRPHVSAQFLGDVERDLLRSLEGIAQSDPALAASVYNEWGRRVRLDMDYLATRHEDPHRLYRALRDAAGAAGTKEAAVDASGALVDSLSHGSSVRLAEDLTRHAEVIGEAHGSAAKVAFRRVAAKRLQCVGEYVAAASLKNSVDKGEGSGHDNGRKKSKGPHSNNACMATLRRIYKAVVSEEAFSDSRARRKWLDRVRKLACERSIEFKKLNNKTRAFNVTQVLDLLFETGEIGIELKNRALKEFGCDAKVVTQGGADVKAVPAGT